MTPEYLGRVRRPSRYLGSEIHAVRPAQEKHSVHIGLAFPDLYEIGMSHVGLNLLYHTLNRDAQILAERVFLPDMDLAGILCDRDIPLTTLETRTPLRCLDILGFTLAYELTYTNVLAILDLGGIPLRSQARSKADPLILAGGPCATNPEPMSAFIDAFVIGEAEFRLPEVCRLVSSWRESGDSRDALLLALDRMEGLYVPSMYAWEQDKEKKVWHLKPQGGRTGPVHKCTVPNLDDAPYPNRPLVPYTKLIHDRISLEVARGCPHGCRFCQAGNLYRPYRERSHKRIHQLAHESLKSTGYEEMSLLALSIGDYTGIGGLISTLMRTLEPRRVSLSLPSIRVGSLEPSVAKEILRVRKTGFTLAPEAATPRLRNVINKNIREDELFAAAQFLAELGWRSLKLYFMIGLPTEQESDVEAIVRLAREVRKGVRTSKGSPLQVTVNVSSFVPKPHTPFQWEAQQSRHDAERKQSFLRKRLRKPGFRLKWHDPRLSLLEGMFARGSRDLCDVLETAYGLGCRMDGWSEHLRFDLWERAFEKTGCSPDDCLRLRTDVREPLPWEWIDIGMDPAFLARECERARHAEPTPFLCSGRCESCGLCGRRVSLPTGDGPSSSLDNDTATAPLAAHALRAPASGRGSVANRRFRVSYGKAFPMAYLSHLETINVFYRALRRSGLPLAFTEGEHPHPKASFSPALPVGVESGAEFIDIWLSRPVRTRDVAESLARVLPSGFSLFDTIPVPEHAASLEQATLWMEYEATFVQDGAELPTGTDLTEILAAFRKLLDPQVPTDPENGSLPASLLHVDRLDVLETSPGLHLRLMRRCGSIPSPFKILGHLFPDPPWTGLRFRVRKTRTMLSNVNGDEVVSERLGSGEEREYLS